MKEKMKEKWKRRAKKIVRRGILILPFIICFVLADNILHFFGGCSIIAIAYLIIVLYISRRF